MDESLPAGYQTWSGSIDMNALEMLDDEISDEIEPLDGDKIQFSGESSEPVLLVDSKKKMLPCITISPYETSLGDIDSTDKANTTPKRSEAIVDYLTGKEVKKETETNLKPQRAPKGRQHGRNSVIFEEARQTCEESWNEEFQSALEMEDGPEKWEALVRIERDFVYCSKTYGKIIISEYSLPDDQKTIPALKSVGTSSDTNVGTAGGEKYISSGIFFKFALDIPILTIEGESFMYAGFSYDENKQLQHHQNHQAAMKAARNDMIGLLSYYYSSDGTDSSLHYPLMSQIDYRGYRLIALSVIPINGAKSLLYGSRDAARTVKYDPHIAKEMKKVGVTLNLKGHECQGKGYYDPIHTIYGPVDIEGHLGSDDKYYVIDFARVFPAEHPWRKSRETFYNLLRPEFVRSNPCPLSSDAYAKGFETESSLKQSNAEVYAATYNLFTKVIPEFSRNHLPNVMESNYCSYRFTEMLHQNGINCRHLGRIRTAYHQQLGLESEQAIRYPSFLSRFLLSEMLARLLNCILRELMRSEMDRVKITAEDPYINLTFRFLTNVLQTPPLQTEEESRKDIQFEIFDFIPSPTCMNEIESDMFWKRDVKDLLQQKFRRALTKAELFSLSDIRHRVIMPFVLLRLCKQGGIKISKHALREYRADPTTFTLLEIDIRKVKARVRHLNVIDEAQAKLLLAEAKERGATRPALWTATNEQFSRAIASNTTNFHTFIHWGEMLMTQCAHLSFEDHGQYSTKALPLLSAAYDKFSIAQKLRNDPWETHYAKGKVQTIRGCVFQHFATNDSATRIQWLFHDASCEFQKAFELRPLAFQDLLSEAESIYNTAMEISTEDFEIVPGKKLFRLLTSFFLLRNAFMVAPLRAPTATNFYLAGSILKEYYFARVSGSLIQSPMIARKMDSPSGPSHILERGMQSSSDMFCFSFGSAHSIPYYIAEAGTMFESAFMLHGVVSDNHFAYALPSHQPIQATLPNHNVEIEIFRKEKLLEGDFLDSFTLEQVVNVPTVDSRIHLVPYIDKEVKEYSAAQIITSKLFALLTRGSITGDRFWNFKLSDDLAILLYHPSYFPVAAHKFSIFHSSDSPFTIRIVASLEPLSDITFHNVREMNFLNAFYLGEFDVLVMERRQDFNIPIHANTEPFTYISLFIEPKKANQVIRIHGIEFYGSQLNNDGMELTCDHKAKVTIPIRYKEVSWTRESSSMTKIGRTIFSFPVGKSICVRASPAFTFLWDDVNPTLFELKEKGKSGLFSSLTKRSRSLNPVKEELDPFLYFEVLIPSHWDPKQCDLSVGVTPKDMNLHSIPGASILSYGWKGGEGKLLCNNIKSSFADGIPHTFAPGDTIGCGYDVDLEAIYWTKNGLYVGSADGGNSAMISQGCHYFFASIGMDGICTVPLDIEANFGENPFLYDRRVFMVSKLKQDYLRDSFLEDMLNRYSDALFTSVETEQRNHLLLMAQMSDYSLSLSCLLRSHIIHRCKEPTLNCYQTISVNHCDSLENQQLRSILALFPFVEGLNLAHNDSLTSNFLQYLPINTLSHIKSLNLKGMNSLTETTAKQLVDFCAGQLECLRVWDNIDDASLRILGDGLLKLKAIELSSCSNITNSGFKALIRRQSVILEYLQIDDCKRLTNSCVKILHSLLGTKNTLRKLQIQRCPLINSATDCISLIKKCSQLVSLSFAGQAGYEPPVDDNVVEVITRVHGGTLKALNLYRCTGITQRAISDIVANCKVLEELNIGYIQIPDAIIATLAQNMRLKRLELKATPISDATLLLFASKSPNIHELSIQRCEKITAGGIHGLLPLLGNIKYLSMKETNLSEGVLLLLKDKDILPNLTTLDIRRSYDNSPTPETYASLQKEKPNWNIYTKSVLASSLTIDGKHVCTLNHPHDELHSVRLRKNSL